jgi:hypothetical protein
MKASFSIAIILCLSVTGCKTGSKTQNQAKANNNPGPPAIVYKMKKDYSLNVPVMLSDDKSAIVSYPAKEDISINGSFPLPTQLKGGYYLDNRGIGPNVAFTMYSYEEYAGLPATPTDNELFISIVNNNPLLEMYDCGNRLRFSNIESDLNSIIESGNLSKKCKKLK